MRAGPPTTTAATTGATTPATLATTAMTADTTVVTITVSTAPHTATGNTTNSPPALPQTASRVRRRPRWLEDDSAAVSGLNGRSARLAGKHRNLERTHDHTDKPKDR